MRRARRLIDALNIFWTRRRQVAGLEALFTDDAAYEADTRAYEAAMARLAARGADCPLLDCGTCERLTKVSSLDPRDVGRTTSQGEAITDVMLWLECSGWYGDDRGRLQQYALWLLERRAAYEGRP